MRWIFFLIWIFFTFLRSTLYVFNQNVVYSVTEILHGQYAAHNESLFAAYTTLKEQWNANDRLVERKPSRPRAGIPQEALGCIDHLLFHECLYKPAAGVADIFFSRRQLLCNSIGSLCNDLWNFPKKISKYPATLATLPRTAMDDFPVLNARSPRHTSL